jgi:hypothetical protein
MWDVGGCGYAERDAEGRRFRGLSYGRRPLEILRWVLVYLYKRDTIIGLSGEGEKLLGEGESHLMLLSRHRYPVWLQYDE